MKLKTLRARSVAFAAAFAMILATATVAVAGGVIGIVDDSLTASQSTTVTIYLWNNGVAQSVTSDNPNVVVTSWSQSDPSSVVANLTNQSGEPQEVTVSAWD